MDAHDVEADRRRNPKRWEHIEDRIRAQRQTSFRQMAATSSQPLSTPDSDTEDENDRQHDKANGLLHSWMGLKSQYMPLESTRDFCSAF